MEVKREVQTSGRRWFSELCLLSANTSSFPCSGEGGTPPPTPSPGPGKGVGFEELERPIWPKMAPRGPQRAQDDLQDGSRLTKLAQDGFQDAPRGPKTAPRRLQEAKKLPKEAPNKPKSFKNLKKTNKLCLLAGSLPMAIRSLKMAPR